METLDAAWAAARPAATAGDAARIARERWGLVGDVRERPSERDRVFEVGCGSHEASAPPGPGGRAILKISNAGERAGSLDLEEAMLDRLAEADLPWVFPTTIPALDGATRVRIELGGREHVARLQRFVPGRPLDDVRPRRPRLDEAAGRLAGELDRAVADLDVPGADRDLVWDLRGAAALVERHLEAIADPGRRELLETVLAAFRTAVAPRAADLPLSIIHNDLNPANLRVDPGAPDRRQRLVGLVDFGDALRSWRIAELATACAYLPMGRPDPVGTCVAVARGYGRAIDTTEAEADVVFELARLRLALSVVISAVRAGQEPENPYLEVSRDPAWRLLERLAGESADLARYRIREALGHPPHPDTARIVAFLEARAAGAAPILDPDPRTAPTCLVDLSIGTGDDGGTFDPADSTAFDRFLFDRLRDAGAAVGIGRWDEIRWWYTGDAFRASGPAREEWRTVHLGLDLFAPAGTPVSAPIEGRVVSVKDNAERLDYGPTVILEHRAEGAGEPPGAHEPLRFYTLYGHLSPETLEALEPGMELAAGDPIGRIGAPPRNGGWAPHLHVQIVLDLLEHEGTFPGVAAPSQRETWLALSPNPNALLGIPAETAAPRPRPPAGLRADRERLLGPSLSVAYRRPLHIVRGRGARLYDAEGQPYLDCVNNVAHVGHAHPAVVEAARRQKGILETNTRYLHETILEYAERLTALFPETLSVCYFVCSGTEASELALRMARTHARKTGAVVVDGAYHGNSSSVINLSPYKFRGPGGKGVRPWVRVVPMPDAYRGIHRAPEPELGRKYAEHVGHALASLNEEPGPWGGPPPGAAAFFCESILGCGGQIPLPRGYLEAAVEHVHAAGAVYVADEVQVGFGRVGDHWWAFEEHGVVPDIVTLGKPMGNGHPLAAVVTTPGIAASFDTGMEYFNTFGGNPVSCAVGLAVLDVIEREDLRENARRVGAHLLEGLRGLMDRHACIGDVRGRGLFLGVELVRDRDAREPAPLLAAKTVNRMKTLGILLSTDGPDHNVIKIKPPLVFSEADADRLLDGLDRVLSETWTGESPSEA